MKDDFIHVENNLKGCVFYYGQDVKMMLYTELVTPEKQKEAPKEQKVEKNVKKEPKNNVGLLLISYICSIFKQ